MHYSTELAPVIVCLSIYVKVPANHLLAASVMSAPAALACAKLIYPETQHSNSNISAIDKSKMNHRSVFSIQNIIYYIYRPAITLWNALGLVHKFS